MKRAFILNVSILMLLFTVWCISDYFYVTAPRFREWEVQNEWTFLFVPIIFAFLNFVSFWKKDFIVATMLAIVAAVLGSVIFIGLVVFFGVQFHFMIGGQL